MTDHLNRVFSLYFIQIKGGNSIQRAHPVLGIVIMAFTIVNVSCKRYRERWTTFCYIYSYIESLKFKPNSYMYSYNEVRCDTVVSLSKPFVFSFSNKLTLKERIRESVYNRNKILVQANTRAIMADYDLSSSLN